MRGLFARPPVLAALALLVPFVVVWIFREWRLRAADSPSVSFRFFLSGLFFWIFAACSIIALAGPRWGIRYTEDYFRGLDAVLAVDVSRSMEVRDADGGAERISRLESGAAAALAAVEASGGIRFGAALGRGGGILAVPLTWDVEVIRAFLESLALPSMSGRGTNLEALIDAASGAFEDGFPNRRIIVLISDGEALAGSLSGALDRAAARDIGVIALAVGTAGGGAVPGLQDEGGAEVYSRRRDDVLRYAALRTGGIFVDGNRRDAAALLAGHLLSYAPGSVSGGMRRETRSREDLFAVLALVFLGASKACVFCRRAGNFSVFLVSLSLVSLSLLPSCSRIPGRLLVMEGNMYSLRGRYGEAEAAYVRALAHKDAVPYAEYGLGAICIARDEGDAALEHFAAAAAALEGLPENRELSYRLKYNGGVALFGKGDYAAAAAAFRDALQTDGSRVAAKRNLELSLLSIRRNDEKNMPARGRGTSGPEMTALFDYLRRREKNQWESREWPEEDPSTPDY
jgi:Ca-activated chloride channel family protein